MTEIIKLPGNLFTIKKDGIFLLSSYNPKKEIEKFISLKKISCGIFYILFGCGLGYLVEELLKQGTKEDDIYIFFPDEVEKEFVLKNKTHSFNILDKNQLQGLLEQKLKEGKKPEILVLESYKKAYREIYKEFENYFIFSLKIALENLKVTMFFSKVWLLNFVRNTLTGIERNYYFLDIKNKIDKPVIICGAGPSLNVCMEEIKKNRKKFIIFAVISSLKALITNEIIPDAVFITDAGPVNSLYKDSLPPDLPVIASIYSSSVFLSQCKNQVIFFDFKNEIENPSFLLENPSVTIDAGTIARNISNGIKIFAGFDMAYSLKQGSHSLPHPFYSVFKSTRFLPFETKLFSFLKRNDLKLKESKITNTQFLILQNYANNLFSDFYFLPSPTTLPVGKELKSLDITDRTENLDFNRYLKENSRQILSVIEKIKVTFINLIKNEKTTPNLLAEKSNEKEQVMGKIEKLIASFTEIKM